jgi:hypothetical protein
MAVVKKSGTLSKGKLSRSLARQVLVGRKSHVFNLAHLGGDTYIDVPFMSYHLLYFTSPSSKYRSLE